MGGGGEQPRAVAKLQALVRIPTVSTARPSSIDTAHLRRASSPSSRAQFPLLHGASS